jgi:hypothetical protein
VRGVNLALSSNSTNAEITGSFITSLNSNGFTLPANTTSDTYFTNVSGDTMVGWQWQAGQGSTSSNTNGTITSTVSVNASAGFSVVAFTTPASNTTSTIGHGLGVAPSLVIVKSRSTTSSWYTYHASLGATQSVFLNSTNAADTSQKYWNNTAPSSSVFTIIQTGVAWWDLSATHVAYCWTPIAGYSAFGSYTGNGSTDGPMIYTGFKPRFILIKCTSAGGTDWFIEDTAREPYNPTGNTLQANTSTAEGANTPTLDILSNGFKVRCTYSSYNTSGGTYIYAAFAENPLKNALAR